MTVRLLDEQYAQYLMQYLAVKDSLMVGSEELRIGSVRVRSQSYGEKTLTLEIESTDRFMDKLKGRVEKLGGKLLQAAKI